MPKKQKNKKKKNEKKKEEPKKEKEDKKEEKEKEEKEESELDANAKAKDSETESKAKISEKSELEEEVETQEIPSQDKFKQFLQIKPSAPVLERVTQEEPEITSLEKGMEITPISGKKEPERKYDETVKYDIESEYQESIKRQREITPEMVSQVAPVSSIDLESIGRERVMPGQEFHMRALAEMPTAPVSQEEYDIIKAKKSKKFRGETTSFQENLERRYEIK